VSNFVKFERFPSNEKFAEATGIGVGEAGVIIHYIMTTLDDRSGVSVNAASMAATAIKVGLFDWKQVAAIFGSLHKPEGSDD